LNKKFDFFKETYINLVINNVKYKIFIYLKKLHLFKHFVNLQENASNKLKRGVNTKAPWGSMKEVDALSKETKYQQKKIEELMAKLDDSNSLQEKFKTSMWA
jgi:hypothetical protein